MAAGEIVQRELTGMEEYKKRPSVTTAIDLLHIALSNNAGIDVIERLAALEEKAKAQQAEIEFNESLNRVQAEIGRIAPDLTNPQTRSKYASYAAIDRVIRPIYTRHGFSLSFSDEPLPPEQEMLRIVGYLSRGGHTRKYFKDMPADGKGAKGNDVMSRTHARGAADAYAKRYMVKDIFNVAVGDEDTDGNDITNGDVAEQCEWLENARDLPELKRLFDAAYKKYSGNPSAMKILVAAKDRKKAELQ